MLRRTTACAFRWRFKTDNGRWCNMDLHVQHALETLYKDGKTSPIKLNAGNGTRYAFDLVSMRQKNIGTGFQRDIMRLGGKGMQASPSLGSASQKGSITATATATPTKPTKRKTIEVAVDSLKDKDLAMVASVMLMLFKPLQRTKFSKDVSTTAKQKAFLKDCVPRLQVRYDSMLALMNHLTKK